MKCVCDTGYEGPDCSLRTCPRHPDPIESSGIVNTNIQKISFASTISQTKFMPGTYDSLMSGKASFVITIEDDMGDLWTTESITFYYRNNCVPSDAESLTEIGILTVGTTWCYSHPSMVDEINLFDEITNSFNEDKATLADRVNSTLRGLPEKAAKDVNVWMEYTDSVGAKIGSNINIGYTPKAVRYPARKITSSVNGRVGGSGYTQFHMSQKTRFPDFSNSEVPSLQSAMECGNSMLQYLPPFDKATLESNKIEVFEGLCLYISSTAYFNKLTVHFRIPKHIETQTAGNLLTAAELSLPDIQGMSAGVYHDPTSSAASILSTGSTVAYRKSADGALNDLINVPLVTIEDVGLNRNWEDNFDGLGELKFAPLATYECSKRGICDTGRGICKCFKGSAGPACQYLEDK